VANQLDRAMRMMRRHDQQQQEEGFDLLRLHAADYLDELLIELVANTIMDSSAGCSNSSAKQAHSTDSALRDWAFRGLQTLDV
jgi:hypothetical protein